MGRHKKSQKQPPSEQDFKPTCRVVASRYMHVQFHASGVL